MDADSPNFPYRSILVNHPDYVSALGMITIEVANLEICLGRLLGAILNVEESIGQIIYLTPKSAFGRLEIIENLVSGIMEPGSEGVRHLESITGKAKSILGKRHKLIHALWGSPNEGVSIYSLPIDDKTKAEPVSLTSLNEIIRDIRNLVATINGTLQPLYQHHKETIASQGTSPLQGA
jgi:hypothetical protein